MVIATSSADVMTPSNWQSLLRWVIVGGRGWRRSRGFVGLVFRAAPLLIGRCARRSLGRRRRCEPFSNRLMQLREVAQGFGGFARVFGVVRRISRQVPRIIVGRP